MIHSNSSWATLLVGSTQGPREFFRRRFRPAGQRAAASSGTGRSLLVASTGGHLEQLFRLRDRFEPAVGNVEWATFNDAQARSLLADETVHYVPYIPPRGYRQIAKAVPRAMRILRRGGYDRVISTGSGAALAFLPAARLMGIPAHYVESSARSDGPSLSGRILTRVPGVHLYCQYERWADDRWRYRGSLFDGYEVTSPAEPKTSADRVVVTLGTMRGFGFRRAVDSLLRLLPEVLAPGAEVLWQVGGTDVKDLPIEARRAVPAAELRAAIRSADLVIAHAGIGSCLAALDEGKSPVLMPRNPVFDEHIDGHQRMIADELDARGLAVSRVPETLTAEDLRLAMSRAIAHSDNPRPFRLDV